MSEHKQRTTADLISELEAEAALCTSVMLAVGFEHTTLFLFSGEDNKLEKLNDMINVGGEPIGLLMLHSDAERQVTYVACRRLEEYAAEPWAQDYLEGLVHELVGRVGR
jgi:hypothetical protein